MKDFFRYSKNRLLYTFFKYLIFALIGILLINSKVKADVYYNSYDDIQKYYDNSGSSVTAVGESWVESLQSYVSNNIYTLSNSYGAGVSFNSPIPIINNHTYTISLSFDQIHNIAKSSKPNLAIGTSLSNAASKYASSNYSATTEYSGVVNNSTLQYVFKASSNANYIFIPWTTTTNTTQNYNFTQIIIDDLGSSGVSETTINNSLNNQTNIINNSINASTNSIKGSISDSQNIIIDNQNKNQEKTNELLGDKCNNLFDISDNTLMSNGNLGFSTKDFVIGKTYTIISDVALHELKISNSTSGYNSVQHYENNGFKKYTFTFTRNSNIPSSSTQYFFFKNQSSPDSWLTNSSTLSNYNIRIVEGSSTAPYCEYGSYISKLDEAENTRKGIWETIKSFPQTFGNFFSNLTFSIGNFFSTLLNGILDGLKYLFIPRENFFSNWIETTRNNLEEQLGFLLEPINLFVRFIGYYENLNKTSDIIIHIPNISVPNFENFNIIEEQNFNWSDLLKSRSALLTLWNLYLDFVDVFLILNLISYADHKFREVFGGSGSTPEYDYYTTEDSYTYDNNTGEVLSTRRNERVTRREKRK